VKASRARSARRGAYCRSRAECSHPLRRHLYLEPGDRFAVPIDQVEVALANFVKGLFPSRSAPVLANWPFRPLRRPKSRIRQNQSELRLMSPELHRMERTHAGPRRFAVFTAAAKRPRPRPQQQQQRRSCERLCFLFEGWSTRHALRRAAFASAGRWLAIRQNSRRLALLAQNKIRRVEHARLPRLW